MARRTETPVGSQMLYWLARAAKESRGDARLETVCATADISAAVVYRFERHETWPKQLDQLMAGYAKVAGLSDARELWEAALDDWWELGSAPRLEDDRPREAVERAIGDETRRRDPSRKRIAAASTSKKKRRASG